MRKRGAILNKQAKGVLRHSIVWKLYGSVLLCIVLLLMFNWLLNNFVLVSYYRQAKEDSLRRAFDTVNALYGTHDDGMTDKLYELGANSGISTTVWNRGGIVYDYRAGGGKEGGGGPMPPLVNVNTAKGEYEIHTSKDTRINARFITLAGTLSNGDSVMMRTPVAAIEESVGITNRFLLISGAVTVLISTVLVLLIARSFTRPIRSLSQIAGSVARLDFSHRYTGRGKDEIADLGTSINAMSEALEHTISDLKTANNQLQNDNQQKEQQAESRRAFIANVSHELKTPISLIQTYAEGLKEDIVTGETNRDYYCEVIEDEAQKMSELLKKMTMLMQLEAGGEQVEIERFDISELLRNLMLKNNIRFAQRAIVPVSPPPEPVYVWADAFLIENVLANYLSNALNHVPDGGRVEAHILPADGGRRRIVVFNTGSHIPEEDLPRVWESFYKVDKARTRTYGGTGIGLSVVAAIMKAHRMPYGVYNVTNNGDSGVAFFIELEGAR